MELLEVLTISLVGTAMALLTLVFGAKGVGRSEIYGPLVFQYKRDSSGDLARMEMSAEAIPKEIVEALKRKVLSEFEAQDEVVRGPHTTIVALAILVIHLVVLLILYQVTKGVELGCVLI